MDQPREVTIETMTLCNAACSFCPYPTLERKGNKMSDELLDRLVKEMAEFKIPFFFSPFKLSDPLLDNRMIPLLERINREVPNVVLRLFTNGTPLTPEKIEQLSRLRQVAHLWISLNSHKPEEYQRIMKMPFERTVKRIDYLHSLDFPHPVVLSAVGFPNHEFVAYCRQRWPKFQAFVIKKDSWLGFTDSQITTVPDTPCSRWLELNIMSTGKVSHCCMDSGEDPRWSIGDLNTQTMLEVYNSPFWRERREKALSRKQLDERSPCAGCTY